MHRPTRLAAAAVIAAATLLALNACSDSPSDTSADETTSTPTSAGPSEETTPTETTRPTGPTATTPPTSEETTTVPASSSATHSAPPADSSPARAKRALIKAADLPGLNDDWVWDGSRTSSGPRQDAAAVCMQGSLTAIGGVKEYRRDFSNSQTANAYAIQQTVVFPDDKTAKTAVAVLQAWQKGCERHASRDLKLEDVSVAKDRTVSTAVGTGHQWMVTYDGPERDTSWFNAEGYLVDGDTLTYLVIASAGQDYNYESGDEPMDRALVVAGDQLKRTR